MFVSIYLPLRVLAADTAQDPPLQPLRQAPRKLYPLLSATTFRQQALRHETNTPSPHRFALLPSALRVFVKRPLIATPPERSTTYPHPNHTSFPKAGPSVLVSAGLPVRLPRPKRSSPSGFAPVQWLLAKKLLCASPASSFVPLCASFVPLFACPSVVSRLRSSVLSWLLVPRASFPQTPRPLQGMALCALICAVVP